MPTPEQELQTIQDKIKLYKEAFEDIKQKLTQARTDISTQAKVSVEDLQAEIPELRATATALNEQIIKLNAEIEAKNKRLLANEKEAFAKYEALAGEITSEYAKRTEQVNAVEKEFLAKSKEYDVLIKDLTKKIENINVQKVNIDTMLNKLKQDAIDFELDKAKRFAEIESLKEDVVKKISALALKEEALEKKANKIDGDYKVLTGKQTQVDEILARIGEANQVLKQAENVRNDNAIKDTRLNEFRVKNIADAKMIAARTEVLDEKEAKLDIREKNLRLAEAKING